MGEKLHQDFSRLHQASRGPGRVRASCQAGDKVAHHRAKPKGEMSSQGATRCHLQTHLLGEEGLPPSENTGDSQTASLPPVVQLLSSQPLTMTPP
jgi:hypothetical protein